MSARAGARRRLPAGPALAGYGGHGKIALALVFGVLALSVVALIGRDALAWRTLLGFTIVVVMFVPIRRYAFAGGAGIQLEPYRLVVAAVVGCWIAALLVDPRVRLLRTGFEAPLALFLSVLALSDVANMGLIVRLSAGSTVIKLISFMISFAVVFYLVATLVRRDRDVDRLVDVLLVTGGIVGFFAFVETRTGLNVFDRLATAIPGMVALPAEYIPDRNGRIRALASAQHPIALAALLAILLPFAVWRFSTGKRVFGAVATGLITIGVLSTVSRTGITMILGEGIVLLWLRPRDAKRLWPAIFPLLLAVHIAVPGALGTLKNTFLPQGKDVKPVVGACTYTSATCSPGRLADLGPTLTAWSQEPVLGRGFGVPHVQVLDDQWLGILLDSGIVGAGALVWVFWRVLTRTNRGARSPDADPVHSNLMVAMSASIIAFAVGMLTFDAFSFIQVTFIFFVVLGLAASLLSRRPELAEPA